MYIYDPAKFNPKPIWNHGTLGFFEACPNKNKNKNKSTDMGSAADAETPISVFVM